MVHALLDPLASPAPAAVVLAAGLAALAVTLAAYATVLLALRREARRRRRPRLADTALPAITVLKPLKGVDDGLYDNLAALARQDHPRFELLCGVADPDDPAAQVVARVAADFPGVAVRLVAGAAPFGLNPKVRNLAAMCRHARHRLVLVSDSNVRPAPGYLRAVAEERLAAGAGSGRRPAALVSSLLAGSSLGEDGASRGAVLEDLHLGTFVAAGVASAAAARQPCVVGKSMLFHLDDLDELGGWAGVADVLAEDYVLGRAFQRAGHAVALSAHVVPVVAGRRRVADFLARHLRWSQMRCRISRSAYLAEALLNPIPPLALAAVLAAVAGEPSTVVLGLAGIAVKTAADGALLARLAGAAGARRRPGGRFLRHLARVPVKDLLIAGVWLAAPFHATVAWRGTRLRIGRGSRLSPLPGDAAATLVPPLAAEEAA